MWSESSPTFLYETSVSDSPDVTEDGEEGQLYQYIFELKAEKDREENEKLQTPPTDDTEEKMTPNTTEVQGEKQQEGEQELNASDRIRRVRKKAAKEKPWRKPGAKISDYFNYGFNEKSWRDYCRRQSSLPAENKILDSKIKVHKCHGGAEMEESCSAPPSLVNPSVQAPREPSAAADVTEGQPAPSGREGRRQCLSAGGNSTQVVTDMSPEEGKMTFYNHLPPSLTSFSRRGPPPLSPCATSESGRGFDNPSTSLFPCSSGLSALIPKNMLPRAGLIDYTEAPAGIDKDRSRERGHDKNGRRGRDGDRESCSSSYSSREEGMRHRETMEQRQRERRHSDESKGRQKPSCSSSRGSGCNKDVGEDRDRESRRKRKRKKKNAKRKKTKRRRRKNKKTNKTSSADGKEIKV